MLVQVIGLSALVAMVVVWFIRDEQRRRDMRERFAAMAQFAPRPQPAPRMEKPVLPTPVRQPVLSEESLRLVSQLGKLHRES